ncbi:MAG: ankyrin repeat domain-containing protein [FCB group bacterium]|nr:ankyrin repeat domain-containing protein [FCB group bacterium]
MSRTTIAIVAAIILVLLFPLLARLRNVRPPQPHAGVNTPLHEAATIGDHNQVNLLIQAGADPNAVDEGGRTPLHLAAESGHVGTCETLLKGGADAGIADLSGKRAIDYARANSHSQTAEAIALASAPETPGDGAQRLNPGLKYPELTSFEAAIGGPGCLLKSEHVYLFAPKQREEAAEIVLPYLTKAYDALYDIVGVHTKYIIVVYNFPPGHADAFGGTSECALWYDDTNLDLGRHEEWNQYKIPHVSGYIEEMGHNFVAATRAQFGWEMVGWNIGTKASAAVASNPILDEAVRQTRAGQAETCQRYRREGYVFPADIPANQVDRIHAYILLECEQTYGPRFWKDFFAEVRREKQAFESAQDRDSRYQLTLECFNRLPGLDFKQRLTNDQISLTRDIKSLDPTAPTWNHRLN